MHGQMALIVAQHECIVLIVHCTQIRPVSSLRLPRNALLWYVHSWFSLTHSFQVLRLKAYCCCYTVGPYGQKVKGADGGILGSRLAPGAGCAGALAALFGKEVKSTIPTNSWPHSQPDVSAG